MIIGVPAQKEGIRPARALRYELNVHAGLTASEIVLTFSNTGSATVVFQVRSGNPADPVGSYTVERGKPLMGSWNVVSSYDLSVYGSNGFARFFKGSIGSGAAVLDVASSYGTEGTGSIGWRITNVGAHQAEVSVLDACIGKSMTQLLQPNQISTRALMLGRFHGWYDLIVTVAGDPTFKYRLEGHVETGKDSFSDPALGGLVTLKS